MNLHFRNLPSCGLPYDTINSAMTTIIKLYEKIPYLPDMQNVDKDDSLLGITLSNIPSFVRDNKNKINLIENSQHKKYMSLMEDTYIDPTIENLESFKSNSAFLERYLLAVGRIKPKETLIRLYGPFSLMFNLNNMDCAHTLTDKTLRKFFIQIYTLKALWYINKIQILSPDTIPIILFEEPFLNKFSNIKRKDENIENYLLTELYAKIFDKIHKSGALIGIQCFEKCDWKIPLESDVDLISFNAYNNPHNLNIISKSVREFLSKGGVINWGIVPMDSVDVITKMNAEILYDKLIKTINELVNTGIDSNLVYQNSLVSVIGDVYKLPLFFSEKALLLAHKIAAKLAVIG